MGEITDNDELATLYKTKNPEDLLCVFDDFQQNRQRMATAMKNAVMIRQKFSNIYWR